MVGALARADEDAEDHWECLRCGGEVRSVRRENEEGELEIVQEEGDEAEREKVEEEEGYDVVDAPQ